MAKKNLSTTREEQALSSLSGAYKQSHSLQKLAHSCTGENLDARDHSEISTSTNAEPIHGEI